MAFIKFIIGEREGDSEHYHDMVAKTEDTFSLKQIHAALNAFLLDFYTNSEWDESDSPPEKVWTGHGSLCWIDDFEELSESDFNVLRDHMNNQSFNLNEYLTNPRFRL